MDPTPSLSVCVCVWGGVISGGINGEYISWLIGTKHLPAVCLLHSGQVHLQGNVVKVYAVFAPIFILVLTAVTHFP
jgi:hypothetical protein